MYRLRSRARRLSAPPRQFVAELRTSSPRSSRCTSPRPSALRPRCVAALQPLDSLPPPVAHPRPVCLGVPLAGCGTAKI